MARHTRRLTDLKVKSLKQAGMHLDGDGLYLRITDGGTKSWIFRFKFSGRLRDMGCGKYPTVGLAGAREMAADAYALVQRGIDPIEARKVQAEPAPAKHIVTFAEAAERYVAAHEGNWRNVKHRQQWRNTLTDFAYPIIGKSDVAVIATDDVLRILEPIWQTKAETASRVRGRIEIVLNWAKVRKLRDGDNPAAWRGHLAHLLPARNKKRTVKHHAAMPWAEVPAFISELRDSDAAGAKALVMTILCALRRAEVMESVWDEFDLPARLWTIPKERMKGGVAFRVPLTGAVMAILDDLPQLHGSPYVFPGLRKGRPLSHPVMLELLRKMRPGLTVHGFRSSFRDWAGDATNFPRDTVEMCLAHTIDSDVEAAYRRSDMIEKRRTVMDAWASFCGRGTTDGKVVPIGRRVAS